jgi:DNA repair photolyase
MRLHVKLLTVSRTSVRLWVMRWESQRTRNDPQQALLELDGLVRSVQSPEFQGITFHEIRARSVLNRVPGQSVVPFRWTVNPYRGCSHACAYCLAGDTPILMTDGRTTPLAELKVGDQIYGTEVHGGHRRYTPTTVLAHWRTVKPAYRLRLADGTRLVASGDHRFLSDRGWKYVTGMQHGPARRPQLTTGNKLTGTGRFAAPPAETDDYRTGYLSAMIRADGSTGRHRYDRPGRPDSEVHRFRLALTDVEALDRSADYLAASGIPTDRFACTAAAPNHRPITAIRPSSRAAVEAMTALIAFPIAPSADWQKGFLAGIFDAGGSYSQGVLRISNTNPEIIGAAGPALKRFGFRFADEDPGRADGLQVIWLLGGLVEHLRFFHTVGPAITRTCAIEGAAVKSPAPLDVVAIEPIGLELPLFDITTGTGDFIADGVVSHNCFARNTHTYLEFDAGKDFDTQVVVKINAPEVLTAQLRKPGWQREHVAMGTNTDPYQRAEGRYRLMPGIIGALADSGTPFSILTKGTMLSRDLPLLRSVASDVEVGLGVSIALLDREVQRRVEPGTPSPQARLEMVRRIRDTGLPCGVMVAPVLPGLSDSTEQLDALLAAVAEAGATSATVLALHLRPGAREWYAGWLAREHPELVPAYREIYAGGSYATGRYRRLLSARVAPLLRRHGFDRRADEAGHRMPSPREPKPTPRDEQLRLL